MEPIDPQGVHVLSVGTVLWTLGLIGTLVFRERLLAFGAGWWTWTCVTGVIFGLFGVMFFSRRERRTRRAECRPDE